MRKKGRIDSNQNQIVRHLRQCGYSVAVTSQIGNGFPDLVVGGCGVNLLVELKSSSKDELTKAEQDFHARWNGKVIVAWNLDQILHQLIK